MTTRIEADREAISTEMCDIPIQETEEKEISSKQVIAGNPVNIHYSYGAIKESISSAYVTTSSLLEKHTSLESEVHKQLLELKSQLKSATDSINTLGLSLKDLKLQNQQENHEITEELSSLSKKFEDFKSEKHISDSERDVRIEKLESQLELIKQKQELHIEGNGDGTTDSTALETDHTNTTGDKMVESALHYMHDDEANQQMKERKQKRLSGNIEDSLEKMRDFASAKTVNRQRMDSGISVNSYSAVAGVGLMAESGESGGISVEQKH